jgi:secreted PhoX family phosphatase
MKRRGLLLGSTALGLGAGLALWKTRQRSSVEPVTLSGTLVRDPERLLDLCEGFRYRVLERSGTRMSDGFRVPGRPDAMGCFALPDGRWALMRNHELDTSLFAVGPYHDGAGVPEQAYDPRHAGGVTRVVMDAQGRRQSSNLVLVGTSRNCAGGMSPWGWLTCEESVLSGHGYVFLCSTRAERVQTPYRIQAYGRFLHEAVAIDPNDHAAYLTEDRHDSCLYRYVPEDKQRPFGAGKLEAMTIAGKPRFELAEGLEAGARLPLGWVQVPHEAGEHGDRLRYAAQERGAAVVRRGEGIWRMQDGFAFTSTSGGPIGCGQVFHLAPTASGGVLQLLAQSRDQRELDMPDNITLTPWGDLLACEDNHREPHLRLLTRSGKVLPFAHNALSRSEFAGVCFSPDGKVLFVNIQEEGITLAIEGPFEALGSA